jgi:lysozyme family protein
MKQNFDQCLEMLLRHEGGFSDHPDDPGGITNLGVTLATYEQWVGRAVTIDEMKALTVKDVAPIYKDRYWDAVRGDDLPSGVDWSVFDWAVNSGPGRASRALQRIVGVTADGKIGPVTLKAVHDMKADKIIDKMYDARQHFYEQLSTFDTFGRGWTRRNKETRQAALLLAE